MAAFRLRFRLIFFALIVLLAPRCFAQSGPTIQLSVDASEATLRVVKIRLEMPAAPGPLTFYYPKWIPGMHQPGGPIGNLTGLKFFVAGQAIPWRRDLRDAFTFHVELPQGAHQIEVSFDYAESGGLGRGPNAGGSITDKLLVLNWNQTLLYPAGYSASQITYEAKLQLPPGWKFGTALPMERQSGAAIVFQPATLERLVDSPVIAGEYYRAIDLTPPGEPIHHEIDLVADSEAALAMSPEVQRGLKNLVAETGKLFGTRHYRDYHFLLTLSDHTPHFGLEHHESNDSRLPERVLLSPDAAREVGGLLAHEFAHSWCGKFRRPKDLATPEYETPMETDLLWVYEGNTTYLGNLLAARSGLWTPEEYRQSLAGSAASLGPGRPGRTWRPLLDTAVGIPGVFGAGGWNNWRRGSDYYEEGELIWLEVANLIHERSGGQKSFEDFFHVFFGGPNRGPEVKTYTFDELVETLHQVVPYDWARFLNERLTSTSAEAPVGGIEASGWKVAYTSEPTKPGRGGARSISVTTFSLGLSLGPDGTVTDALFGGPAFQAGIAPGMKVVGVNGRVYKPELLSDAIKASSGGTQPIQLLVVDDDYYRSCAVEYHGGERYPHLVREPSKPDYLDELVKPLTSRE